MRTNNHSGDHLKELLSNWRLAGFASFMLFLFVWFLAYSVAESKSRFAIEPNAAVKIEERDKRNTNTPTKSTLITEHKNDTTKISHSGKHIYSTPYFPALPKKLELSFGSVAEIENFIRSSKDVQHVIFTEADFKRNIYQNVFVMSKKKDGTNTPAASFMNNGGGTLFSENTKRNGIVLDLMNGSLVCEPFAKNQGLINIPSRGSHTMCAVSVPPIPQEGSQEFGGFMTVLLDNDINSDTADKTLPSKVFKLAMSIYNRDVIKVN